MMRAIKFSALLLCVMLALGCSKKPDTKAYTAAVIPTLNVTGDVANELEITSYEGYADTVITWNEQQIKCIKLLDVLDAASVRGKDITLFFSGSDGVMAEIPIDEMNENCYMALIDDLGWCFISEAHPKQSRIKHMAKIVVAASEPAAEGRCLRLINGMDVHTLTYGQLYMEEGVSLAMLEGQADMNGYTTNAYTYRTLIPITNLLTQIGAEGKTRALAYFGDGSQQEVRLDGYIEWRGNSADYLGANGKNRKADIIGIWVDAPKLSVMDVALKALEALDAGRVMIIELDGLGYHTLTSASPEFLCKFNIAPARTVMPSVSSVALASIVTGLTPDKNGIAAERLRELTVPDIFAQAAEKGKTSAVIEGSSKLITMSADQVLNPDINNNGSTDDEVFASAKSALAQGTDFVYVHFHGFDDVAHTFGPDSTEAKAKLLELDGFVSKLCEGFLGTVIITSDHGQHPITGDKLGEHGEFLPLDMTVPFIIIKTGV